MNYGSRKKFRLKQRKKGFEISDIKKRLHTETYRKISSLYRGEGGGCEYFKPLSRTTHTYGAQKYLLRIESSLADQAPLVVEWYLKV